MFSLFGKKDKKKIESLENRVRELELELTRMKKLALQASADISSIDTVLRVAVTAQGQLASDVHEIYTAVQKALNPEDYYADKILRYTWSDDDDDGGMLN